MTWDLIDYLVASVMVTGLVGGGILVFKMSPNWRYRLGTLIMLITGFLLVWINGAVGIIGSEDSTITRVLFAIPVIVVLRALWFRFSHQGMASSALMAAVLHGLVAITALISGAGAEGPIWPSDVILASVFFIVLWAGSAALFWTAKSHQ